MGNTLNTKELTQIIIGQDPKKKYNKTWHRPQFLKSMQKDKVQQVNSIHNADEIYSDLMEQTEDGKLAVFALMDGDESQESGSENEAEKKEKEEKLQQERIESTIDFLYD